MNFKIPFSGRGHAYNSNEIDAAIEAMHSPMSLTQGVYKNKFEKKFTEYADSKYSYAVNTATSALELTAQLCQFNDNDEVIIPSHTYTSSAYPFIKAGAKIVWADIELDTRVVSCATIEPCITEKTKAIVVPHLYGYGADMDEIMDMAKGNNIIVIEDAAQSLGVRINGRMTGTIADFGVYSFHSHKNMTTLGEGGMITTNHQEYAELIPMLRHNGHCDFSFKRENYWRPAMGNVDLPVLNNRHIMPSNYCMGEVECAIGIELLDRIEELNQQKRDRAIYFIDSLKDFDQLAFHRVKSDRHNYHLLVAMDRSGKRDEFIKKMAYEEGIQCVVQYYPLNRYDLYDKLGYGDANCPNADTFFDNMISFPFQHMLTDSELDQMIDSTKSVLKTI